MGKYRRAVTITEDHVNLLRRAFVRWEDCEFGAPAIDCKRPYGNRDVLGDMAEILRIPRSLNSDGDHEDLTGAQEEQLRDLHKETLLALQIFLDTGKMEPGYYVLPEDRWRKGWVKSEPPAEYLH